MNRPDPYRVYLFLSFASTALFAVGFPMTLYEATTAALDPLQLVLVGTTLELSVLLFEVPTGVVADVFSRRLSVIIGHVLIGLGLIGESLFPSFLPILLAQVIWGIGYTFTSGATQAWLSDEIGEELANRAMLTASRYGLSGALVGVLAATAMGSFTTVAVPIFFSGAARLLLAVLLVFLMVERNFKPAKPEDRSTFQHMGDTFRKGLHTIRLRPSLLAVLGVGLFYGLYSDGYDRLWIKHLLGRFDLPRLFGNNELAFFGVLEVVAVLLSILLTRWAEKRFDTGQPRTIGHLMLGITAGIAVSIAAFAWSPFLGLALALYLVTNSLRDLASPLMAAWMNQRLDPDVRATVLSMIGQVDAVGQITGGPAIGAIGRVVSLPLAVCLCGGLLAPALVFIRRANRQAQAKAGTCR